MKDLKITFSDDYRDFAPWAEEKNKNVLKALCWVLREYPGLKEDSNFQCAVGDSVNLFALFAEDLQKIVCNKIYRLILQYDIDGYEFLEDLIHDSKCGKLMKEIYQDERSEEILELIEANDKENRSKIAELLAVCSLKNAWVERLADDIEEVHQGRKDWEWFYKRHCDDRSTFELKFTDNFIKEVYEYFKGK